MYGDEVKTEEIKLSSWTLGAQQSGGGGVQLQNSIGFISVWTLGSTGPSVGT